jgi:hypothetical protein
MTANAKFIVDHRAKPRNSCDGRSPIDRSGSAGSGISGVANMSPLANSVMLWAWSFDGFRAGDGFRSAVSGRV